MHGKKRGGDNTRIHRHAIGYTGHVALLLNINKGKGLDTGIGGNCNIETDVMLNLNIFT